MRIANRPPRRRLAAVLVTLIAALAIAACGSSSGNSPSASRTASLAKFTACLKQHGVTLPSRRPGAQAPPTGGQHGSFGGTGGGFGGTGGGLGAGGGFFGGGAGHFNSKFGTAFKDCSKYRPAGAFGRTGRGTRTGPGAGGGARPHFSTKVLTRFVACVRRHGYPQMPNPSTSGQSSGAGFFPKSIERNSKFQTAATKCASILRQGFGQAAPGGVTSTTTSG